MSERINPIPVLTWNHMHVNEAHPGTKLPELPQNGCGMADVRVSVLPECIKTAQREDERCASIATGCGEAVDSFIRNNANTSLFMELDGEAEGPVYITKKLSKDAPYAVTHLSLHAKKGSKATFIVTSESTDENEGLDATLFTVYAEDDADIKIVHIQMLNDASRSYNAAGYINENNSHVELVRAEVGSGVIVSGSYALLEGRASSYDTYTVYFGENSDLLDFNDVSVHTGCETLSEIHANGVLKDRAVKALKGTIDFKKGAKRSIGHESDDVLMLSPTCINRTAPIILCAEEEVEGQHASTIGRLNDEMLYYIQSRGISVEQAQKMMVEARFATILDRVPDENIKDAVLEYVGRKLD